ncbi:2Fe-2S iron-sulfur cluster-binding protein [Natrinema salsiterrestre]|uniref:2Fe-2S iron-sulfur cluster-binding protein n=1 Tax=Natrinema salsiterrestre TaxID=2950540 RepID=A0A9Q4L618_9EURY|nr:2Fe-2S iron-sulfur cluster-binding protein [Natrinema salsiterrestre]MDF9747207.1 2Fe-2S iron-sulfur cluster-binding protein [Natrinema salsiterrestre]
MTSYDVTLERTDGPNRTIEVADDETVLDAAQRAGIRLPYDCRKGTCITCVGRLLGLEDDSGESDESADAESNRSLDAADAVAYRREPRALTDDERADGYVLLCIAHPRTDCRIEVGPRVRAEVGDSPWS